MRLARYKSNPPLISLVPMIDVMLILLVFFMVTSTYLNLDMIPFVQRPDEVPDTTNSKIGENTTLLVRISADGQIVIRGQPLAGPALTAHIAGQLKSNPLLSVVILPSTQATTQHLVSAMDILTRAGVTRLRLLQLEARK